MAGNSASTNDSANESSVGESQRRTGVWVAVGLLALVFGLTIALTHPTYDRSNPFWFVGMLVIFGAALSLIAVVFRWLNLSSRDEAFSLPSGSVRTLLAIGVMVLFAVFGLEAVSVNPTSFTSHLADQPISAVSASASAALDAEIKRYERQGVAAVIESIDGERAKLQLYRVDRTRPAETVNMQKQVVTALITLVTAVVSFYFGSRSVEAARDAQTKAGTDVGGTPLAAVEAELKTLDAAIADNVQRLTALQSEGAAAGNEAALATVLAQLAADAPAVASDRSKLDALLAGARSTGQSTPAIAELLVGLRQKVAALSQRLADAEALVAKG